MDVTGKVELVARPPTEEVVRKEELVELFETNSSPRHYIGLEVSGFLHMGSLISTGFKINDFIRAGVDCTVFLADWHTVINDKLGGDWGAVSAVSRHYKDAFELVCPGVNVKTGSELYGPGGEYWAEVVRFAKHMSLARTMRALTIMGRSEEEERVDLAKLLYPPMQAVDIHSLDVDIAHAGMDQRKIHMLAREIFPKMGWKVPVAVHQRLLPGLAGPAGRAGGRAGKMSKSDPGSGVFIHDTDDEIRGKIKKSWCDAGSVEGSPLLEIARHVVFHEFDEVGVERPGRFGGNVSYSSYEELEADFGRGGLHPADLKRAVGECLVRIISPIREKLPLSEELRAAISGG